MDADYKKVVAMADHYKAIGETKVFLYRGDDAPWEHVTSVDDGCLVRLGTTMDVRFTATHPCGIEFSWHLDLENRDANGSGQFDFNIKAIRAAMRKLPDAPAKKFAAALKTRANALRKRAAEYQAEANNQCEQAACLENILDG